MHDNKVSEKAIWEGSIAPDNDTPTFASQMQNQPQMMFCYKCNNVIPGNSKFCPCCQTELYVTCPKCGVTYSSQYPNCNQCGTNKSDYLKFLREEKERQEEEERINKRRREILECERYIAQQKRQEKEKQEKEAYNAENTRILTTNEYKSVYSLFVDAFNAYESYYKKKVNIYVFLPFLIAILTPIICLSNGIEPEDPRDWFVLAGLCFVAEIAVVIWAWLCYSKDGLEEYLSQYMKNRNDYDKELVTSSMIRDVCHAGDKDYRGSHAAREHLSRNIIIAYRKKYNLPVNDEWHT